MIKTLKKDFSVVEAWVERSEIGNPGRVTFIVIASSQPTPTVSLMSLRGPERVWQRWADKNLSQRIDDAAPPTLSDDYAPVDRLMSRLLLRLDKNTR